MNPVPKPLFLALALAAASAHAIPCPAPIEVPEGEGIEASHPVCGALGVFTQHGKKGFFDPDSGAVVVPAQFDAGDERRTLGLRRYPRQGAHRLGI
ncbi:hypothetical protein [Cardiobacterium hominis]